MGDDHCRLPDFWILLDARTEIQRTEAASGSFDSLLIAKERAEVSANAENRAAFALPA